MPHILHRINKLNTDYNEIPPGIFLLRYLEGKCPCPSVERNRITLYKISIFLLTYLSYACYHMTRKPISVVKSVLHEKDCVVSANHTCGFAPFDRRDAEALFGMLDSSFLFSYATAMFVSGLIAERVPLRNFLTFGMLLSGTFTFLLGFAKIMDIHDLWYFLCVQALGGIFQSTGWPIVVSLLGRWFGKAKRGLIFGIWNSHTSIGNILGTLIAAYYVESNWAQSFCVPGIAMFIMGIVIFFFLVDSPEIVDCEADHQGVMAVGSQVTSYDIEFKDFTGADDDGVYGYLQPISLGDALAIPGVVEFSLCLFFSKLVSYTFLYWLPLYIQLSSDLGPSLSADLSTLFDVGGIFGAILAGFVSDRTGMSAMTCFVMLLLASPTLLVYQMFGTLSIALNIVLLLIAGMLVNGPYALITTKVSAELGQHHSLEGNAMALATVIAIVDGTGSLGAAIGPLLAGFIFSFGWEKVFYMLIGSNTIAMIMLVRLVRSELRS